MIRVALCMQTRPEAARLERMLRRRFAELHADASVRAFFGEEELFSAWRESEGEGGFSMALLDTAFSGGRGLDAAERLRGQSAACPIAFLSENERMALPCFRVHPSAYFVKPVDYAQLCSLLDWHKGLLFHDCRTLGVVSGRIPRRVFFFELMLVTVSGRTATLSTPGGELCTNRSLAELYAGLDPCVFVRCARSALVNVDHVAGWEDGRRALLLKNGVHVPVSADREEEVAARIAGRKAALDGIYPME